MGTGQQVNLSIQRTHVVDATAVHALALVQQPAAHDVLLQLVQALVDLLDHLGVLLVELSVHLVVHGQQALVTDALVVGIQGVLDVLDGELLDGLEHSGVGIVGHEVELGLANLGHDAVDEVHDLLVGGVTGHDGIEHGVVVNLVGAGLDHSHQIGSGGDGHVHLGALLLLSGGVDDELAVNQTHDNAGDGAIPGDVGDSDSGGSTDHSHGLGLAIGVNAHHGADQSHIVAHILGEQGADGTVDHTRGQNGLLAGAGLTALEGAGNLTHGVHLLLIVHGHGEEIHALTGLCGSGDGAQHDGLAIAHQAGTAGQLSHLAGLDDQGTACQGSLKLTESLEHKNYLLKILIFQTERYGF